MRFAAAKGDAEAQMNLAAIVAHDKPIEAVRLLKLAEAQGCFDASMHLADVYCKPGQPTQVEDKFNVILKIAQVYGKKAGQHNNNNRIEGSYKDEREAARWWKMCSTVTSAPLTSCLHVVEQCSGFTSASTHFTSALTPLPLVCALFRQLLGIQ
ncbi:hypothetical protein Pelo_4156 [Pelomyxa schiedti]|nr:hypothetical protein Pelo_4156 [Pelomyxa schiedti]